MSKTIYRLGQQRFFDEVTAYLISISCLGPSLELQALGKTSAYTPRMNIKIEGKAHVTNEELGFFPYDVLGLIVANSWPTELEVEYVPLTAPANAPEFPVQLTGAKRFHVQIIEAAFQGYFEKVRPLVEQQFGSDTTGWPDVWNFGRVVRNTMSHGGEIEFRNPRAAPVRWRNLTYSPADNGKQIIYVDLTPVEVIRLMEDMDAAL